MKENKDDKKQQIRKFVKESKLTLIITFLIVSIGIAQLFMGDTTLGTVFICLGIVFLLSLASLNAKDLDFTVLEKDEIFQSYLVDGKKIKAVKYCRSKVKCGLKEALDYVEKHLL